MRTRERRPTVYVMDATGNTPAASFRHRLAAALRASGSNAAVKLTRPHNAAAVEREIGRTRRHFAAQFPDGYELPEDFSHFTTSAETALHAALRGDEESAFAIVAVVGAAFVKEQRQKGDIQYPARFFLRNERPDALIPVLIDGPAPSRRSRDLGMRLLAAVPAEDWREGPTNEKFSSLATRLVQVLEVPFPADRRTTPRATQSVVRVDANGTGDCYRISEGLALVADGGRVEVYPGHYLETPMIGRSVQLVGVGPRESIRVGGLSTRVPFRRRGFRERPHLIRATIENLSFEPTTVAATSERPTIWLNGGNIRLRDCTVTASANATAISDHGIDDGMRRSVFDNCLIHAGASAATFVSRGPFRFRNCIFLGTGATRQSGLAHYYSAKGRVNGCTFVDLDWPVSAQSAGDIDIRNSTIIGGSVAIHLGCTARGQISSVQIQDALWAVQVADDASLLFSKCRITGSRAGGIVVKGSARAIGWDSVVRDTDGAAGWVAGDAELLLVSSRIERNKWGIFAGDSAGAEVSGSRFLKNQHYAVGGAGTASVVARANLISQQNIGVQFTEGASGEVSDNFISKSSEYSVGVWSSGSVSVRGNRIDTPNFVARESEHLETDSEAGSD